ncbi:MRP-L47-domain-containing protein [Jackrogersella minutella]|nr:MRP-L47-domain-containing protein [Jackrogersella minutella]
MAMATSVRPSIGRIISVAGNQHAAKTSSFLTALLIRTTTTTQSCQFSSTPERNERQPRRDNNRLRGLSSIHRSGPRYRMNISKDQVPKPSAYEPEVKVDPNHGLWGFFYSKEELMQTPDQAEEHGRGWTVEELRHKSWTDLHSLWWVCVKEQNRIATARKENARLKFKVGEEEMTKRMSEVRKTMKAIKHTLTERYYVWEDARKLAETDPEIDLTSRQRPYTPQNYFEEAEEVEEKVEAIEGPEGQEVQEEVKEGTEKSAAEKVDPSTIPTTATESQQPPARV